MSFCHLHRTEVLALCSYRPVQLHKMLQLKMSSITDVRLRSYISVHHCKGSCSAVTADVFSHYNTTLSRPTKHSVAD